MGKANFTFDTIDEAHEVSVCANIDIVTRIMHNISDYTRHLYKYEERDNIPIEEVTDKLQDLMKEWYYIDKTE